MEEEKWKPEWAEEYDKFMNEQFRILMGHASRCFLRCHNKYAELSSNDTITNKGGKDENSSRKNNR